MRIFTRYILREVLSYAALGGLLFTFVLFMRDMSKIIELLVRDSASLLDAGRIFADLLPSTLTVTLPTAVLAGVLLGLGRLAADSEITAMRACGIGAVSFVKIVSIVSFSALGLGLINTLYFAPHGAADLLRLEDQLKTSQAAVEIQPRVFYEDFKNYVLYVQQDARPAAGAAVWRHVFLADLTAQPENPNITTADEAIVSTSGRGDAQTTRVHLLNADQHHISPTDPSQYELQTYGSLDLPLQPNSQDDTHISRIDTPLYAQSVRQLIERAGSSGAKPADARIARIELNRRIAYPFACLVLMLIGVPLGLSSRRGGKSTGFVLTLLLVFAYYLLSNIGVALAKTGKVSPFLGVWAANICFALFGLLMLRQLAGGGFLLNFFNLAGASVAALIPHKVPDSEELAEAPSIAATNAAEPKQHRTVVQRLRRLLRTSFPLLLDEYVMRSYATNFLLSLGAFALLYIVFTFFELMGDIVRNQTPFVVVGAYLFNLIPFIISQVTPICSLLAVLVTFGSLNRTSELTAMKATGISLYRVVAPILLLAAVLAAALFAFNESYLPGANRKQEALRAEIKGKPAQTFQLPGRTWISGQTNHAGEPIRIFYYQAFDPARDVFADLSVFEFDAQGFILQRRVYAKSVQWDATVNRWIFENGWQRTFSGTTVSYQPFTVATFPEVREQPAYFNKENKPSDEMSYAELSQYIADLRQSGFNTVELRVQLQNKLSVPAISFIMAIIAVPFALSMGKRGGLIGVATAIGVALVYWTLGQVFSSMGNVSTLPPILAAWSPDLLFGLAGGYLLLRTPT
ncbi:MAG TPA: LptF/LptG family permease [Acidobacteriaceae bacterium]|jgi:LPS export ABC transporter permease LptG/LPS export ABC transporter permease LptF|nr:LptF/LptG family permease [Acidobacteriaceae bacterium]